MRVATGGTWLSGLGLAAQVEQVVGTEQVRRARHHHALDGIGKDAPALAAVAVVADADRIQHRGDAGADDLRIVRQHGG